LIIFVVWLNPTMQVDNPNLIKVSCKVNPFLLLE